MLDSRALARQNNIDYYIMYKTSGSSWKSTPAMGGGLAFTRYCFTSRLYCTIIFFANTPFIVQYIVQYYRLLHPPAQFWGIFEVFWVFFCFLGVEFRMGRGVWKIIPLSTGKRGIIAHYCAIPLSQPPFIAYNIAQYISPTTPFIAIKYMEVQLDLDLCYF